MARMERPTAHSTTATGDRLDDRLGAQHGLLSEQTPSTMPLSEPLRVLDADEWGLSLEDAADGQLWVRSDVGDPDEHTTYLLDREQVLLAYHALGAWLMATAPANEHDHLCSVDCGAEAVRVPRPCQCGCDRDEFPTEPLDATSTPSILEDAQDACYGDRQDDYGHPRENMTRTAIMWTALLQDLLAEGAFIDAPDVARCMVAVKLARDVHEPKRDNRVDGAGYFAVLDRLETGR